MVSLANPKFFTVTELAEAMQITKKTIYCAIRSGELWAVKVGRVFRISETALQDYLNGGGAKSTEEATFRRSPSMPDIDLAETGLLDAGAIARLGEYPIKTAVDLYSALKFDSEGVWNTVRTMNVEELNLIQRELVPLIDPRVVAEIKEQAAMDMH